MEERTLPVEPDVSAPDGSEVRVLCGAVRGSMAHFRLGPHQVARAVVHRSVEEIWYVVSGRGEIWRRDPTGEQRRTALREGVSLTIPVGTAFQFRNQGADPLDVVGVTMPPWPGEDEALPADGPWTPTV
jgi:mannose-6-phosphate isomerase-like protein (cupin superfamily)